MVDLAGRTLVCDVAHNAHGMRFLRRQLQARGLLHDGQPVRLYSLWDVLDPYRVIDGLGWIAGEVVKITPSDPNLKIPHMGWNRLQRGQGYFATCHDHFYFVHSYAASGCRTEEVLASVDYGGEFVAVIGRENILATQFHPEKSQKSGFQLLRNFLAI